MCINIHIHASVQGLNIKCLNAHEYGYVLVYGYMCLEVTGQPCTCFFRNHVGDFVLFFCLFDFETVSVTGLEPAK